VARLGGPLVLQNVLGYGLTFLNVVFCGRLSRRDLATVLLANSVYNVTGLSLLIGLASALETYCGNAYGGGQYGLLNGYLLRALMINLLACVLVLALWSQTERVLVAMGMDDELASAASTYLRRLSPSLFFACFYECSKRYMQSICIVVAPMLSSAVVVLSSPLVFWLCIFRSGWGLAGAAFAVNLCTAALAAGVMGLVAWVNLRGIGDAKAKPWEGVPVREMLAQAFTNWRHFLDVGVPATIQTCAEWWVWEIIIVLSSLLPPNTARGIDADMYVAVMGILLQLASMTYMVLMALQQAAATRVAMELGRKKPAQAQLAAGVCLLAGRVFITTICVTLVAARSHVPLLFTDKDAVRRLTAAALPWMALSSWNDCVNGIYNGVLRGCGRQWLAAVINTLGNWGIGLPLSALLGLRAGYGVRGLWTGIIVAMVAVNVAYFLQFLRLDWEQEALRELHPEQHSHSEAGNAGEGGGATARRPAPRLTPTPKWNSRPSCDGWATGRSLGGSWPGHGLGAVGVSAQRVGLRPGRRINLSTMRQGRADFSLCFPPEINYYT